MLQVPTLSHHHDDALQPQSMVTHTIHAVEFDSRRLLQGQREVVIRHGGECYRLRHTRNDKLILTK